VVLGLIKKIRLNVSPSFDRRSFLLSLFGLKMSLLHRESSRRPVLVDSQPDVVPCRRFLGLSLSNVLFAPFCDLFASTGVSMCQ